MNTTSSPDSNDTQKKAQALLRFALGNHNAKRYNEAAGFYEYIIKCYPNTEASQFAQSNLSGLVNKVDALEPVKPDETLIARIEQSIMSESVQNIATPIPRPNTTQSPEQSLTPPKKRLRITENPYLLAGLFFLTAVASYFIGREHVKYEIRQALTGAVDGFRKNMSDAMAPLRSSNPNIPQEKNTQNLKKPKTFTFPVRLNSKELTKLDYRSIISFRLTIDNTLDRPIKAFEGRLLFKDVLGKLILGANMSYRDGIAAKGNTVWSGEIEYNQFIDHHRELANVDKDQLIPELEIYKVAYEDGTVEEFPKP